MPSSFLDLPAEIRNDIFRLLLTHTTPIVARSCNDLKPPQSVSSLGLYPNICLASRAVHAEASWILYGENTFQAHPTFLTSSTFAIDHRRSVHSWRCVEQIRRWHVRVRLDCDPFYTSQVVVETFTGADALEVEVFRASWGMGGYGALEAFTKVRGVRKAKVHGSLETNYAKWLEVVMMRGFGAEAAGLSGEP
ncbi:MAG: hypothetical protein Q9173_000459 [Seirophora scorigena]